MSTALHGWENYTRLSPNYTTKEWWGAFAKKPPDWQMAISVVEDRFTARFIQPIDLLLQNDFAGFAITALDCLLLESLHAFRTGKRSRDKRSVYRSVLTAAPFSLSGRTALEFYEAVRCGLLEDGEARYGWNIILRSKTMFQEEPAGAWTMNRTMFHERLKVAVGDWLGQLRAGNESLRENMRARMDEILRKHYLL